MKFESKLHILTWILLYMGSSLQLSVIALNDDNVTKNIYNDTRMRVSIPVFPPTLLKLSNLLIQIYLLLLITYKCLYILQMGVTSPDMFTISKYKCKYASLSYYINVHSLISKHFKMCAGAFPTVSRFYVACLVGCLRCSCIKIEWAIFVLREFMLVYI